MSSINSFILNSVNSFILCSVIPTCKQGAFGAVVGYFYGKTWNADSKLAAMVISAQFAATFAFTRLSMALVQPKKTSEKMGVTTVTFAVSQTIYTLVMRHFNLIAERGTRVFAFTGVAFLLSLLYLKSEAEKHEQNPTPTGNNFLARQEAWLKQYC